MKKKPRNKGKVRLYKSRNHTHMMINAALFGSRKNTYTLIDYLDKICHFTNVNVFACSVFILHNRRKQIVSTGSRIFLEANGSTKDDDLVLEVQLHEEKNVQPKT